MPHCGIELLFPRKAGFLTPPSEDRLFPYRDMGDNNLLRQIFALDSGGLNHQAVIFWKFWYIGYRLIAFTNFTEAG